MGEVGKRKFIIMTYPRTGSTLLCSSLGAHPEIETTLGTEMFHEEIDENTEPGKWRKEQFAELYGCHQSEMTAVSAFGEKRLDTRKFDLLPFMRRVVERYDGFKLMYHQLDTDSNIWSFLLDEVQPKIIYMKRDLLDASLSLLLALKTGVWQAYQPEDGMFDEPMLPKRWGVEWFYSRFCVREQFYKRILKGLGSIEVDYDVLVNSWDETIFFVERFLGISEMSLPQYTFKRTLRSAKELLINYRTIQQKLRGQKILDYARLRSYLFL